MNMFNKYVWLVELLQRQKKLTIDEIGEYWRDSGMNYNDEKLNKRTFHRWREAIGELLGIDIECDVKDNYNYSIQNIEDLNNNNVKSWLVNTMAVSNIIEEYKSLNDRIFIDNIPSSECLRTFLDAMKLGKSLLLTYHPFNANQLAPEIVEPHCIRCFERRWYAIVRYVSRDTTRIIALDRIVSIEITNEDFVLPKNFDAEGYFRNDYGIGIGFNEKIETILLKINAKQRPYTDSLPLHHSQKEIEHHDDYSIYELDMKPTKDLARAILPYGKNIQVLKPDNLRRMVAVLAKEALDNNPIFIK